MGELRHEPLVVISGHVKGAELQRPAVVKEVDGIVIGWRRGGGMLHEGVTILSNHRYLAYIIPFTILVAEL